MKEPNSPYHQAWLQLKESGNLILALNDPTSEKTVRAAIIEYKKKDKTKNPRLRLKITKKINPSSKKLELHFQTYEANRASDTFFNL